MSTAHDPLALYLHLAGASERRRRPLVRDKMLVLAAVAASERGLDLVAACCRRKVLGHNAGHLVSQYATLEAALEDERFQIYLRQLRRNYPVEKAEHMLTALGIQIAGERAAYYTDHEYAAALLGTTPDALEAQFGENGTHLAGSDVRASELVPDESRSGGDQSPAVGRERWQWIPERPPAVQRGTWILVASLAALGVLAAAARFFWRG